MYIYTNRIKLEVQEILHLLLKSDTSKMANEESNKKYNKF